MGNMRLYMDKQNDVEDEKKNPLLRFNRREKSTRKKDDEELFENLNTYSGRNIISDKQISFACHKNKQMIENLPLHILQFLNIRDVDSPSAVIAIAEYQAKMGMYPVSGVMTKSTMEVLETEPAVIKAMERLKESEEIKKSLQREKNHKQGKVRLNLYGMEEVYSLYEGLIKDAASPMGSLTLLSGYGKFKDICKKHNTTADDFLKNVKAYENYFEKKAAISAHNILDIYEQKLKEAKKYYSDMDVLGELFKRFEDGRITYEKAMGIARNNKSVMDKNGKKVHPIVRASQIAALAGKKIDAALGNTPLFNDGSLEKDSQLNREELIKASNRFAIKRILDEYIGEKLYYIKNCRDKLKDDPSIIFSLDNLLGQLYQTERITPGSIYDKIIKNRIKTEQGMEAIKSIFISVLAIGLGIISGGTGTIAMVAGGGAISMASYEVYDAVNLYNNEAAFNATGLSSNSPNELWVFLAVVGAGVDVASAVKIVKGLKAPIRALDKTGDIKRFERNIRALQKVKKLDSKIAEKILSSAKAHEAYEQACKNLVKSFNRIAANPFADPEVYKQLVDLAYYRAKKGILDFQRFLAEVKQLRQISKIDDGDLDVLRRAYDEGVGEGHHIETKLFDNFKIGKKIAEGGNKVVYTIQNNNELVVAVLKDGKPINLIDNEISMLKALDEQGLAQVKVLKRTTLNGKPAIVMKKYAHDSKKIVRLQNGKVRFMQESDISLLNERSIKDLTKIRNIMVDSKISIDDLQFLIGKDGSFVISDPLNIYIGVSPSKRNLRIIDLLIKVTKNKISMYR